MVNFSGWIHSITHKARKYRIKLSTYFPSHLLNYKASDKSAVGELSGKLWHGLEPAFVEWKLEKQVLKCLGEKSKANQ